MTNYEITDIGLIPEDWTTTKIKDIGTFYKGKGIKKDEVVDVGIPCIRYGELYTKYEDVIFEVHSFIPKEVASASFRLKKGDVLFAGSGETREEIGKSAALIIQDEVYAGGDIVVLRPTGVNSEFLGYLLNSNAVVRQKSMNGQGDAVVHIYSSGIGKITIPLPPTITEQKVIATALSDVDALITSLDKLIAKKQAIKQGAMQELLTGKTRLAGFGDGAGYKMTEVGRIPGDWDLIPFDNIFSFHSTSNYSKAEMSNEGDVGCIHYGLIHAIPNSQYNLEDGIKYYVSTEQAKYEFVRDGDVIMVDASEDLEGINKSVEVFGVGNKKFISGLHTYLLRDKNNSLAKNFRGIILSSQVVKNQMLQLAVGMKVFGVSKTQLIKVKLPLPPTLTEQQAIAATLSDMDSEIEDMEIKRDKYKQMKQGMMQELLTGKTRLIYVPDQ